MPEPAVLTNGGSPMSRDRTSSRTAVVTAALLLTACAGSEAATSTGAHSTYRAAGAVPLSMARVLVATSPFELCSAGK